MRKKLINIFALTAALLVVLGVASCEREDAEELSYDYALPPKESAIYKHIADHKKERTRAGEVKLEPVVYEGDTVMYVANYGEGWEVFSNSTTMPMVLMRSETGRFDASSLSGNPAFTAFFDMSKANLSAEMHDASAEAQPGSEEWAEYVVPTVNGGPMRKPAPETMVLVGIGENAPTKTERTEHLIKTRWSQGWPYNQYIPFSTKSGEKNLHVAAGCGAIAAAQYLYYHHNQFKTPSSSVTNGIYSAVSNSYSFSGTSSTIWEQMPLGDGLYLPTVEHISPAALLIGRTANGVKTVFAKDSIGGSACLVSDVAVFLNQQINSNMQEISFSTSKVVNRILYNKEPVITTLTSHLVIIDDVKKVEYGKEQFYAPSSAVANIQNPTIHYGATLESMRALYGNGVTCEIVYSSTSYFFRANWGWGRFALDPEINSSLLSVSYDTKQYKVTTIIY